MYPSYSEVKKKDTIGDKANHGLQSVCPLGCLCCIMQQFYNRRCWCREVKESTGTQTDPVEPEYMSRHVAVHKTTTTVATQTETKENFPPPVDVVIDSKTDIRKCIDGQKLDVEEDKEIMGYNKRFGTKHIGVLINATENKVKETFSPSDLSGWTPSVKESAPKKIKPCPTEGATPTFPRHLLPKPAPAVSVPYVAIERMRVLDGTSQLLKVRKSVDLKAQEPAWNCYRTQGTPEHTSLQSAVNDTMEKYDLSGAKDPHFETALEELLTAFPTLRDSPASKVMVRNKLRHRISSRRHYSRIRTEASAIGMAVSTLKRRKMEENAIQHQLLGETIVRNSLNPTPPPVHDYSNAFFDLKPTSQDDVTPSSPLEQTSYTSPDLHSVLQSRIKSEPSLDLPSPPVAHSAAQSCRRGSVDSYPHILCGWDSSEPRLPDLLIQGIHQNSASVGVKEEVNNKSVADEEALDLSDPRHDVTIKIEPLENGEIT